MDPGRSQWPRSLRRGSAVALVLGLWVRIQRGAWISLFLSSESCLFSGRGFCASGCSLVQKSPTESGMSECDRKSVSVRGPGRIEDVAPRKKRDMKNLE